VGYSRVYSVIVATVGAFVVFAGLVIKQEAALRVLLQSPMFGVGRVALSVGVGVCGALKHTGLVMTDAAGVAELAGVA
jgi:hypothetical protein